MVAKLHAGERKKTNLNTLRRKGKIPAVIYGKDLPAKPIFICGREFQKQLSETGRNGIFPILIGDEEKHALVREYAVDPITREIIHVDFLAVDPDREVTANVLIVLMNEAFGVKDGGVLQQSMFELSVTAPANELPEAVEIDVTDLKVGETITVGDIRNEPPYQINHEDDEVIASILPPKQEEEISTGEQQEPGMPKNLEGREK